MKPQTPRAPRHLQPATRRWWSTVIGEWTLDQHHVRLLTLAATAWDRAQQAREMIERDGLAVKTRDAGLKLHPACRVEQASMIAFARLLRELDLDVEPPADARRPPQLRARSTRRSDGAA
jgi:P27 family predicted phage terminase small subunit